MVNTIETDVLIIGGGSAGIAAAIAASENCKSVVLVERSSFLGGKASAAIVGTLCGLYQRNKSEESIFVCKGFAQEFAELLQKKCKTKAMFNAEGLHYLPYDPFEFKVLADELLSKENIQVFLHTTIFDCTIKDQVISEIEAFAFDKKIVFKTKAVVDCSGEAVVSEILKLPILENNQIQAAAQVFALHNVDSTDEKILALSILKELTKAVESGKVDAGLLRTSIVPGSLKNKKVFLKVSLPYPVILSSIAISKLEKDSRKIVFEIFHFLKNSIEAFKNTALGEVASQAGIRTGKEPIGQYILTEEDVLNARKFEDGVANASWPIEFWELGKKVQMQYFNEMDYYQVPARCLTSSLVKNLFFGGRAISADNKAIASARVIGTCLQTGYAAGKLSAAISLGNELPSTISEIRKFQLGI